AARKTERIFFIKVPPNHGFFTAETDGIHGTGFGIIKHIITQALPFVKRLSAAKIQSSPIPPIDLNRGKGELYFFVFVEALKRFCRRRAPKQWRRSLP
ncbi:MAG: hypothetical protein RR269_04605, partial [Oscillospiraceae bacterium]